MRHLRRLGYILLMGSWWFLSSGVLWAEAGILVVRVEDAKQRLISGMEIGVKGDGGTAVTGGDGKARIPLAKQTKEKGWVVLQIVRSPSGRDFQMVSPWDNRTVVPSFENESENLVVVVVVQRGDRAALESSAVLASLTGQIIKANALETTDKPTVQEVSKAKLAAVAKQYGLTPDDLDQAIGAWGARAKANDPFQMGLAAMYQRNYSKAATLFAESLQKREGTTTQDDVAEAAWFLGLSLFEEGKYPESAAAYQRCLQLRPDDSMVLNNLGVSLLYAGNFAAAEPLDRQALAIDEQTLGPEDARVAMELLNLADLLRAKGDYAGAEPLYRRALAINEKALGPEDMSVAGNLNNLAILLRARGDYPAAESLWRRALTIHEKALGSDHPDVARDLNNLAALLMDEGNYEAAEPLCRRTLAIDEKVLGLDHPDVAKDLSNLASLLEDKGDYAGAELLYRRALAILEKALGPDHPDVGEELGAIAQLLDHRGDHATAEALYMRALAIEERALGPEHPDVATALRTLGKHLWAAGNDTKAEPLLRRALTIDEKSLGPEHPNVANDLNALALVLQDNGDETKAEPLYRRALAIDEEALGANHPTTQEIRKNLTRLTGQ